MVDGTEEVSSGSSRKTQDKEETTPEASWAAVAGREAVEAGTRRRNGDAGSHSLVKRGGRRPCEP